MEARDHRLHRNRLIPRNGWDLHAVDAIITGMIAFIDTEWPRRACSNISFRHHELHAVNRSEDQITCNFTSGIDWQDQLEARFNRHPAHESENLRHIWTR